MSKLYEQNNAQKLVFLAEISLKKQFFVDKIFFKAWNGVLAIESHVFYKNTTFLSGCKRLHAVSEHNNSQKPVFLAEIS